MTFTFRQLEIFVEAAADSNFRKTADRLGISQPGISKQIRALEKVLGKTLFVRARGAAAQLSEDGETLLASAHDMLARQRRLNPARTEAAAVLRLRVITGDYLLDHLIKPALPLFYKGYPTITLDFQVSNERGRILDHVRTGKADLALYTGSRPDPDIRNSEIVSTVPCSLYAAPEIARRVGGDIALIAQTPFVLPSTPRARSWVLGALERVGLQPNIIAARTQFGDVLAEMVRDGFGIGLLFDDHAGARFSGQIHRLPVDLEPAYRVMVLGEGALDARARPCLQFMRRLLAHGTMAQG
ncbi:MAG TPA: LysR family transcriptional regulator [Sphingobium sp.]|nr:LysR family transcriptional regulator [Sphingobium sp.]